MDTLLTLDQFDYNLPPQLIAQHPPARRDECRLMVVYRDSGRIEHRTFRDIGTYMPSGTVLVINNTRVIPGRLWARKPTGGRVEILLIKRLDECIWEAMLGGKVRPGMGLAIGEGLACKVLAQEQAGRWRIQFDYQGDFNALLNRWGYTPLPPYIKRPAAYDDGDDRLRYQTVYASQEGAIAAPTAGLHFTPQLLDSLKQSGVIAAELTLQIGPATFLPVKDADLQRHRLEAERFEIPEACAQAVNSARQEDRAVIAVGTSSLRALESAHSDNGRVMPSSGDTALFITPGYKFKSRTGLLTNFHLPRSTNLMLVAALAGHELTLRAYNEAVRQQYEFYSYGDAMLVL